MSTETIDRDRTLSDGSRITINRSATGTAAGTQLCRGCSRLIMVGDEIGKCIVTLPGEAPYRSPDSWLHIACAHTSFETNATRLEAAAIERRLAGDVLHEFKHTWRSGTQKDVLELTERFQGESIIVSRDDSMPRHRRYAFRILTDVEQKAFT